MSVLLRGKGIADEHYGIVKTKLDHLRQQNVVINLAVLVATGDPASAYYVQVKRRIAERLGIGFQLYEFAPHCEEIEIASCIKELNVDPSIHGIMLELPLPAHLSTARITELISPDKDVDGVTPANKLSLLAGSRGLVPATPQACIRIAKYYGYTLEGRNVTLVGRGQTVGMPLFHLLQHENATVTVCHSRTVDIKQHLANADIIFVAVGSPGIITREMTHERHVIIDAGINELSDGSIVGDVEPSVSENVAAFTPTPGGVGALTTAILFENVLKAYELQVEKIEGRWKNE